MCSLQNIWKTEKHRRAKKKKKKKKVTFYQLYFCAYTDTYFHPSFVIRWESA